MALILAAVFSEGLDAIEAAPRPGACPERLLAAVILNVLVCP